MHEDIYSTYRFVNSCFHSEFLNPAAQPPISRMREINNFAYFVLLFAQLENRVNDQFDEKRNQEFEIERRHPGRTSFMERVEVAFDGNPKIYDLVDGYYEVRCQIAHGNLEENLFAQYSTKLNMSVSVDSLNKDLLSLIKY